MKYLDKVDEKVLVKKLTEKIWKKYKTELDTKRLKNLLKDILKEEKVGFTYTWRIMVNHIKKKDFIWFLREFLNKFFNERARFIPCFFCLDSQKK